MDTVTYPDNVVAGLLAERFAVLKLNLLERHPDFKDASGGHKVLWAPALIFSDARGRELRRFTGWLPPGEFLSELRLVLALHDLNHSRFDEARAGLEGIIDAGDEIAAEALYWHGIAGFLGGQRDMDALTSSWKQIIEEHPGSRFATHASVIE